MFIATLWVYWVQYLLSMYEIQISELKETPVCFCPPWGPLGKVIWGLVYRSDSHFQISGFTPNSCRTGATNSFYPWPVSGGRSMGNAHLLLSVVIHSNSIWAVIFVWLCFKNNTFTCTFSCQKWEQPSRKQVVVFKGEMFWGGSWTDWAGDGGLECKSMRWLYLCFILHHLYTCSLTALLLGLSFPREGRGRDKEHVCVCVRVHTCMCVCETKRQRQMWA